MPTEAARAAWNTFKAVVSLRHAEHQRAKHALAMRLGLPTNHWHYFELIDWLHEAGGEELVDLAIASPGLTRDVDNLGKVLAIQAGEYDPVLIEDVDVRTVVQWADERCYEALRANETWLRTLIEYDLPPLAAHMNDVADILAIVVDNAIAVSPVGGRIAVTVAHAEGYHRFEIADSGPGLDPDEVGAFFKTFDDLRLWERAGNLRESGFNLVLARLLVEFYGGRMGIDSNPGHGSVVWFTLKSAKERVGAEES